MSLFGRLSEKSRIKKLELFYSLMKPGEETSVLDVGAEIDPLGDGNMQLIDSYEWNANITAVNISQEHVSAIIKHYPQVRAVVANACTLPWPDKSFDVAYSNAVIEHVGDSERQRQMAIEIMRVAKRWFVTTPNRWYPYEFHLRLPFVTWLPGRGYVWAGRIVGYNHVRGKYMKGLKHDDLYLLSARQMQSLFPQSRIIKQRITFMAETLIAVGGEM